jgi:hypothetical protein
MRFETIALAILAIAGAQAAQAQDGTLRPAHCRDRATLLVRGHNAPPFPVMLSSLDPGAQNARWHLMQVGERFAIVSYFTQYGTVALTVTGNGSAGSAVVASQWTQGGVQRWDAVNHVDRAWYFAWPGNGLALKAGDECNRGRPLVLGPNSGNNSWVWNAP